MSAEGYDRCHQSIELMRCLLVEGHDGPHKAEWDGATIYWGTSEGLTVHVPPSKEEKRDAR